MQPISLGQTRAPHRLTIQVQLHLPRSVVEAVSGYHALIATLRASGIEMPPQGLCRWRQDPETGGLIIAYDYPLMVPTAEGS